nr:MAG TPA: hypothetical protein [Caudoviricetes sp.]
MYWLIFPKISVVLSHQLTLWALSIFEYIDSHLILFLVTYVFFFFSFVTNIIQ